MIIKIKIEETSAVETTRYVQYSVHYGIRYLEENKSDSPGDRTMKDVGQKITKKITINFVFFLLGGGGCHL
jgi:hypothetical protein